MPKESHMASFVSGLRAHFNHGTNQFGTAHSGRKGNTMNKVTFLVALVATLILLTGCSANDAQTTTYESRGFSVTTQWPSICESESVADAARPTLCWETLTTVAAYKVGDTNGDGLKEVKSEAVAFERPAGNLSVEEEFAPPPIEAGQYAEVALSFSGLTLGEDWVIRNCDSNNLNKKVELLPSKEPTTLCIQIAAAGSSGGNTGTDQAQACVSLTDEYGTPLTDGLEDCAYTVAGTSYVPSDNSDCGDAYLAGIPVMDGSVTAQVCAVCGSWEGCQESLFNEGQTSAVTITMRDRNQEPDGGVATTGTACTKHYGSDGAEMDGCVDDWSAIDPDPQTATPPTGTCDGTGQSYYTDIFPHNGTIWATCSDSAGKAPISIEAGKMTTQEIWVYGAVADNDICSVDHAFILDAYVNTVSLQSQVGFGVGGGCSVNAVTDWEAISVVSLDGPDCTDINDSSCRLSASGTVNDPPVNGLYAHLIWNGDVSGMDQDELLIYVMGIEDSGSQQSMERSFWLFNGDAQIVTTMSHEVLMDFTEWLSVFAPEVRRIPGSFWKSNDVKSLIRTNSKTGYFNAKRNAFETFVLAPQAFGLRQQEVPSLAHRLQLIGN